MSNTNQQYDRIITICRDIFEKKMTDYGTAWRLLRPSSMTDQIYIKAQRIRSIEEKGVSKVGEGIRSEYIGIINYCAMALIQLKLYQQRRTFPRKNSWAVLRLPQQSQRADAG